MSTKESKPLLFLDPEKASLMRLLSKAVADYEKKNKLSRNDSKEMIALGKAVEAALDEKEMRIHQLAKILEMEDPLPLILLVAGVLIPADARPLAEKVLKALE